ncbi:nucleoside hydrolase [Novosphingobium sp. P6W]|uniref:nucleoside hydrolase n=1 Tax=Novosphingobium sp. P6W TaxID=1609758 RepID=UPI0005C2F5A6|nr:nucleoside hydrolase [Novosphingobium sp. P6W]AXB77717.1 nucleoside hydrolase [Novosphingobium sp. P6W]KIS30315.1 nucleoside hydrolase [Novosphingobium sp. P6W]
MKSRHSLIRAVSSLLLAVAVLAGPHARAQAEKSPAAEKIIIDDEGFSLMHMMLLNAPGVEVLGLTSVSGNLWSPRGAAMQLRGLEVMGRTDVPVAQGAVYPLVNTEKGTERWEALYGKLTWKGAWMKQWAEPTQQSTPPYYGPNDLTDLPWGAPTTKASPEMAALFMIRMVHQYPGQITIVEGGPMTNLALAQRLDPEFAGLAKGLVYMGGSFNPHRVLDDRSAVEFAREFANSPRREFNIRFDPEAASIVSRAPWKKITVVPADPSTATQLSRKLLDRAAKAASPALGKLIAGLEPGFPLWDEIAAAVFLDPAIVTGKEDLYVDYDTQFGAAYGDTLSWREHYQPGLGEVKASVVLSVDPRKLEDLIVRVVAAK